MYYVGNIFMTSGIYLNVLYGLMAVLIKWCIYCIMLLMYCILYSNKQVQL
jgi:hypothetical protein